MTDNKRTAAYENIFGRPSAQHHHRPPTAPPPLQYSHSQAYRPPPPPQPQYHPQPQGQAYLPPQQQQGYYLNPYESQPRRSYAPSVASVPPGAAAPYVHQYSASQPSPSGAYRGPPLTTQSESGYAHAQSSSVVSAQGIVAPVPDVDVGPAVEGLTPAQAYQAQVYQSQGQQQQQQQYQGPGARRTPSPMSPPNHTQTYPLEVASGGLPAVDVDWSAMDFPSATEDDQDGSTLPYMMQGDNADQPGPLPHSLTLNTSFVQSRSTSSTPSIPTSPDSMHYPNTDSMSTTTAITSPRLSTESIPTISTSRPRGARPPRTVQDRSQSMSATTNQARSILVTALRNSHPLPSPLGTPSGESHHGRTISQSSPAASSPTAKPIKPTKRPRTTPLVYPALLSKVAEAFRARVPLSDRTKDGLTYSNAFDGREAVDTVCFVIKTADRCLALLLGRALDAQKFFHDVVYEHRLRDSGGEVYQFGMRAGGLGSEGVLAVGVEHVRKGKEKTEEKRLSGEEGGMGGEAETEAEAEAEAAALEEDELPTGVFTLLTDCYSPTCTRDRLCYSIACPRRLEQQSRLNLKQEPGLKRTISRESLGDLVVVEPGTLWVHSVPQEVVDSVDEMERKRQEAINEVMYTERDFVRGMEYMRDLWIKPLQKSDHIIVPEERKQDFLSQVFWNVHDIISVNTRLRDALNKRQKSFAVVERIGDILLDAFPHFEPFVSYGAHQLYGKYEFEKEKASNPAFAQFVEETERRPESRKLELNGYLTKPTTRLARYPLLLEVVLKYTPDDNPDKTALPQAVELVRKFLEKVNVESGKTENRFNLLQLDQHLVFRPGEYMDLKLKEEGRELLYKGPLKRTDGGGDVQAYLFDHALLMVKQKTKHEQHKVYRRPIPLSLLVVTGHEDPPGPGGTNGSSSSRSRTALIKSSTSATSTSLTTSIQSNNNSHLHHSQHSGTLSPPPNKFTSGVSDSKNGYPLTFTHLGKHMYQVVVTASTWVARKKWVENVRKQQEKIREQTAMFGTGAVCEGFFNVGNRVLCAVPFNGGRKLAFGSTDGVYFFDLREPNREPVKVVALPEVKQLDVLDDYQLLIVLCDNALFTFPLDALDPRDPSAGLKRAKKISGHTSFFKAGICLDRTLVCVVKASALSSTVKVMEPIDFNARTKNKPTFRKVLQGGNDTLKVFREFYIPVESSSIHFLRTKVCVGCEKGFEIVDLKTLETQPILHPDDSSLDFVQKREVCRPQALYRIDQDFLLCYDEFAFYIDRTGCRARPHLMINWEGNPTSFALHYPYLLAFEPNFVEIRHVETGQLSQIIPGSNIRCLFAYEPPSQAPVRHASDAPSPYNSYSSYSQYAGGQQQYNDRGSVYSQFGAGPQQQRQPYGLGGPPHKIIMVSEESVVLTIHPLEGR